MVGTFDVVFLGTGSMQPSLTRNVSAVALRLNGAVWLFDCGEATQHQINRSSVRPGKIQRIFITHLHGDHLFGLPGLLCTISHAIPDSASPLVLVGPVGLRRFVRASLQLSYSNLGMPIIIHELHKTSDVAVVQSAFELPLICEQAAGSNLYPDENAVWRIPRISEDEPDVLVTEIQHTVPTFGFVVQERESPGKLDPSLVKPALERNRAALKAGGVNNPMSLLSQLKSGLEVPLPDGTILRPSDCVGPSVPGRKVVVLGDTCESSAIADIAVDCDLLIHECTNACVAEEDGSHVDVEQLTISHGHSTPQMAGRFAKAIHARNLVLTHFSQRYKGDASDESMAVTGAIRSLAMQEFQQTNVIMAVDLMQVEIFRDRPLVVSSAAIDGSVVAGCQTVPQAAS